MGVNGVDVSCFVMKCFIKFILCVEHFLNVIKIIFEDFFVHFFRVVFPEAVVEVEIVRWFQ